MAPQYLMALLVVVPVLGGIACAAMGKAARLLALVTAGLHVVLSLWLASLLDWHMPNLSKLAPLATFAPLKFGVTLGTDPLSTLLTLATGVLAFTAILASTTGELRGRDGAFYGWLCGLVGAMTGVWLARDLLLFYCFFELILVPLFFLIGTFGGPERRTAAAKLFIYTFTGSILALPAILYLGIKAGTFERSAVIEFAQSSLTMKERGWILAGLLCSFAVKTPLFPLHTWQPSAMAEAPGSGVVDAVGMVLKLGAYAMMTIALPIGLVAAGGQTGFVAFPNVLNALALLAVIGILYGALCAWVQTDMKRLLAYSSLSHVGFVVLGVVSISTIGLVGAGMYLVNTALITGALFLTTGMIYQRYGTRDTSELSGLGKPLPILSFFLGLFVMAAIGLPLTSGFVSEFLTVLGAFNSSVLPMTFGIFAALGIVLGAIYMLSMAARVLFGAVKVPAGATGVKDLCGREIAALSVLAVLILVLGVYPKPALRSLEAGLASVPVKPMDLAAPMTASVPAVMPGAAEMKIAEKAEKKPAVAQASAVIAAEDRNAR